LQIARPHASLDRTCPPLNPRVTQLFCRCTPRVRCQASCGRMKYMPTNDGMPGSRCCGGGSSQKGGPRSFTGIHGTSCSCRWVSVRGERQYLCEFMSLFLGAPSFLREVVSASQQGWILDFDRVAGRRGHGGDVVACSHAHAKLDRLRTTHPASCTSPSLYFGLFCRCRCHRCQQCKSTCRQFFGVSVSRTRQSCGAF
jgi:hypothetical protein